MKRISLLLVLLTCFPLAASASGQQHFLQAGQSSFVAGKDAQVKSFKSGDLFAAGLNVQISAAVQQDAFVAGRSVGIFSKIFEDLRAIGQEVFLGAKVGQDAFLLGENVEIGPMATVDGELFARGENVKVSGDVLGNANIAARVVEVSGTLHGNANIAAETLVFSPEGRVAGDLHLKSAKAPSREHIGGQIHFQKKSSPLRFALDHGPWRFAKVLGAAVVGIFLWKFATALALAALAIIFLKRFVLAFQANARKDFLGSLKQGFLFAVAAPVAAVLLFFSIVLMPLGAVTGLTFAIFIIFAKFFSGFFVGSFLLPFDRKSSFARMFASFALGQAALLLVTLVPLAGWLAGLGILLVSLGTLVRFAMQIAATVSKTCK